MNFKISKIKKEFAFTPDTVMLLTAAYRPYNAVYANMRAKIRSAYKIKVNYFFLLFSTVNPNLQDQLVFRFGATSSLISANYFIKKLYKNSIRTFDFKIIEKNRML
jgi:hypothetical protein